MRSRFSLGRAAPLLPLLLVIALAPPARSEIVSPIGGVLPVRARSIDAWIWSGAWRFPVGDPRDYQKPGSVGSPAFKLLRGIGDAEDGGGVHQGADLGCGHGGDPVFAAAAGMVLFTQRSVGTSGYGRYVVLGHRLPEGGLAYSVYAHLAAGSILVGPGQMVEAGRRIGRVGMSGRATSPHLHFEIRLAGTTDSRWEKEEVVDPLAFVAARLGEPCGEESLGVYVAWAQYAGLVEDAPSPRLELRHSRWWRMLAVASRQPLESLPRSAGELADSLIAVGVLPNEPHPSSNSRVDWPDLTRDLKRIRVLGLRLPRRPMRNAEHRAICSRWLGVSRPAESLSQLSKGEWEHPTLGVALLALADLAPPLEAEHHPKPAKIAKAAKRSSARSTTKLRSHSHPRKAPLDSTEVSRP